MIRRRRSALLGLSALSLTLGAAGCERPTAEAPPPPAAEQTMPVYASKEDCAKSWDEAGCDAAFKQAAVDHEATAPKFASRAECEEAMGAEACQERRTSGGSFFMPLMMGMMMGQMMNRQQGYPVYADRRGAAFTGTTRVADPDPRRAGGLGRSTLPGTVAAGVTPDGRVAQRGSTTRGGFGQTSSYRGSAGG